MGAVAAGAAAAACCVGLTGVELTGIVLGTTLRAIGRGLGNGTFGLAEASAEIADSPTASARLVASAVDRNAAARAERVTAFLCGGESFTR
jgi:phosphohistidine swiveling domain-containing protein